MTNPKKAQDLLFLDLLVSGILFSFWLRADKEQKAVWLFFAVAGVSRGLITYNINKDIA